MLLARCFRRFVLPVLEYFTAVWCSAVDTHLKLLDRVVSGSSFLTRGVFECGLAHRRSVSVLCMLYKIRCNSMHLYMELYLNRMCWCLLQAVLWSHIGSPMRHPCGSILVTLYAMVWDWWVSRAVPIPFYLPSYSLPLYLPLFYISLLW